MECPHCGLVFFVASASSEDFAGDITGGVECPACGEFISDEELSEQEEEG